MLARRRATLLAAVWALGAVLAALLCVVFYLLAVDYLAYDGNCPGSLLPFIGRQGPRACSFGEYFAGHGLFTLEVFAYTLWPIVLLFVVLAIGFGVLRDRQDGRSAPR